MRRHVGAVVQLLRRVEAQHGEVEAAIGGGLGIVAGGILLEQAQHVAVDADVQRIDRGDVGGVELRGGAVAQRHLDDALLIGFARERCA